MNCVISNTAGNQAKTFAITDRKIYVPVVNLKVNGNGKLLQQLKTIKITQKQQQKDVPNQYLDYLIDPSFQGVMLLACNVLACNAFDNRTGHSRYYIWNAKEENYNVMIDGKIILANQLKLIWKHMKTFEK